MLALAYCTINVAFAVSSTTGCPPSEPLGSFNGNYGPYDYITQKGRLNIVEVAHFTPEVAALVRGEHGSLGWDISYTLIAFPNHHRALESLAELAVRDKTIVIPEMKYSVPCYFIRALKFMPTDGVVSAIYATYLARIGQKELALSEAESAIKKNPNIPKVSYNVGLAYYYLGDLKKAREYSEKAKKLGYTAIGLDKLLSKPVENSKH